MRRYLKRRFIAKGVAALLAGAVVGLSLVAWAAPEKDPAILIPQPTFNAGKIIEGKTLTHTFVIKNRGSGDLMIQSVKPG